MKKRIPFGRGKGGADDAETSIQNRINEFNTKTIPSVEFFKSKRTIVSVSGELSVDEVHKEVLNAIGLQ